MAASVGQHLRMSDASVHAFTSNLGKCTLFLVMELTCSSDDLVRGFCLAALSEYSKSSMGDQIYKFSRLLCSSLFALEDSRDPLIMDLLERVLHACKVHRKKNNMEFTEFVSYCANKCRTSRTTICSSIARDLIELADDMKPLDLILKIYATGLHFISCNFKFQVGEAKDVALY